jgi:hypothetical protein
MSGLPPPWIETWDEVPEPRARPDSLDPGWPTWRLGWTLSSRLQFGVVSTTDGTGWLWSAPIEAHAGPASSGQVHRENLSSVGLGVAFTVSGENAEQGGSG